MILTRRVTKIMSKLISNKKGILGLDTVKGVVLALLTLSVLVIATLLALTTLGNSGLFPTTSAQYNYSNQIISNISSGAASFFSYVPTIFVLLAVVVLILIIAIVIVAVSRFGGGMSRESL